MIKFSITRRLQKIENKVIEILEVNPKTKILSDSSRSISTFIQNIMSLFSMGHIYPLSSITQESPFIRIHELKFKGTSEIPKTFSELKFNYIPNLGKKRCSKCLNSRVSENGQLICKLRGKKIFGDIWKNCLFYIEKSILEKV